VPRLRLLTGGVGYCRAGRIGDGAADSAIGRRLRVRAGNGQESYQQYGKNATMENPLVLLLIESLPRYSGRRRHPQRIALNEGDTEEDCEVTPTTQAGPPRCSESDWYKLLPHEQTKSNRQNVGI